MKKGDSDMEFLFYPQVAHFEKGSRVSKMSLRSKTPPQRHE